MIQFEAGKTYATRFIGDADNILRVTIAKRTAKTVTTTEGKTFRVTEYNGLEQFAPLGRYSMSPVMSADRLDKTVPPKPEELTAAAINPQPFWGNPNVTVLISCPSGKWQAMHKHAKELDAIATDCCAERGQSNPDRDAHLCASQREQARAGYVLAQIAHNIYGFCLRDTMNDGQGNILHAMGGGRGGNGSALRALRFAVEWQAADPERREVIQGYIPEDARAEYEAAIIEINGAGT